MAMETEISAALWVW